MQVYLSLLAISSFFSIFVFFFLFFIFLIRYQSLCCCIYALSSLLSFFFTFFVFSFLFFFTPSFFLLSLFIHSLTLFSLPFLFFSVEFFNGKKERFHHFSIPELHFRSIRPSSPDQNFFILRAWKTRSIYFHVSYDVDVTRRKSLYICIYCVIGK